jgi:small conductance mechanosensitive channel
LIRAWAKRSDFWDVFYSVNEQIYKVFSDNGIDMPFPQMTVHLAEESKT